MACRRSSKSSSKTALPRSTSSSEMISVELVGDREVIARFEAMPANARSNIARTVAKLGFETEALTKRKLSGQVLNVGTGLLRSSINTKTTADSNSATATIGTNVKYAGIHEFGG